MTNFQSGKITKLHNNVTFSDLKWNHFNHMKMLLFSHKSRNYPANSKHVYNIYTMLVQRLWRWSNIVQILYTCFEFAGWSLESVVFYSSYLHVWAHIDHTDRVIYALTSRISMIPLIHETWKNTGPTSDSVFVFFCIKTSLLTQI